MPDSHGNAVSDERDTAPQVERWDFEKEYKIRKPIYDKACEDLTTILTRLVDDLAKEGLFRARADQPRVKGLVEVKEKAERQKIPLHEAFDRLHDMVGTRIVCNNLEDIDKVIDAVTKHPRLKPMDTDPPEKISQGTDRGYRGRNMIVELVVYKGYEEVNVQAEIQVRTLLQDAWGRLSHDDFYKPKGPEPPSWLDEQMKELSDRLYELDRQAQSIRGAIEKRYVDMKKSLSATVASKLAAGNSTGALSAVVESYSSSDPGMQLVGVETFLDSPGLWTIGMRDFVVAVTKMNDWLKTRLIEKLSEIDPAQIPQFDPVLSALTGD